MFAEVLPIRKLPKSLDYFDYQVPSKLEPEIKIGQIVVISFRRKNIKGVVVSLKKTSSHKNIKSIIEIVSQKTTITRQQLSLADYLSKYYCVSRATILRFIIPPLLKNPRRIENDFRLASESINKKNISNEVKKAAAEVLKEKSNISVFHYLFPDDRICFFLRLIENIRAKNKQTLIIFPEIIDIYLFLRFLPKTYQNDIVIQHHRLSQSELTLADRKIRKGVAKIILGTPSSVFSPFKNLGLIIIDQEESQWHKQSDQNPRFHAKKAAEYLIKLHRARLILATTTPSLETHYQTKKYGHNEIKIFGNIKKPVKIINLKISAFASSYHIITESLYRQIERNLKLNKKTLLFLNRKGFSRAVICQDCHKTLLCPNCQVPYTVHFEEKYSFLYCFRCGHKSELILKCPFCHGANIRDFGLGTEKLENEVRSLFPKARVNRYDDILKEKINLDNIDVLIGTQLIFKHLDWKKIDLVGVISADVLFNLPDYRSQEKAFQLLSRMYSYCCQNPTAQFFIQTYSPNISVLANFPFGYERFFRQQIAARKDFGFPPFVKIIKLIAQNKNKDKALKEAKAVYENEKDKSISPPLPAFIFKKHKNFRYQLVLKLPISTPLPKIKGILTKIPDSFIIDIDPDNLL